MEENETPKSADDIIKELSPEAKEVLLNAYMIANAQPELREKGLVDALGRITDIGAEVGSILEQIELAAVDAEAANIMDRIVAQGLKH